MENESLLLPERSFRSPKENLYELIQQVEPPDLCQSLRNGLKRLIIDQDRLMSMLQQRTDTLETENEQLKQDNLKYQQRYEKAVREAQFFRLKCDGQNRPRKLSIESGSSDEASLKAILPCTKPYPLTPTSPQAIMPLRFEESVTTQKLMRLRSEQRNQFYHYPIPPPPETPPPPTPAVRPATTYFILKQQRVDPLTFGGSEALWETIAKGDGDSSAVDKIISNFLRRGGSPNTATAMSSANDVKQGYGMIHALVVTKALSSLELLLEHGANPNAMTLSKLDDDKVTPCYLAARGGWLTGLQKLVQAGGDLLTARGEGVKKKTVLHVAAEHCHASVVEYIVAETQGRLNLEEDSNGATALHYACASGHTDLSSFLLQTCKIPVNQPTHRGELPLHWAASHGRLEVVALLIERYGCDMNACLPRKVGTPLDLAKVNNHRQLVDYLKGLGAKTAKKLDKRREEELEHGTTDLLHTLEKNGFFSMGDEEEEQII